MRPMAKRHQVAGGIFDKLHELLSDGHRVARDARLVALQPSRAVSTALA